MAEPADPIRRFRALLRAARRRESHDATAAALATADRSGRPSARMILLKGVDERGFVFYTNLGSRKAHDLAENPWSALVFHWPASGIQVRIEGTTVLVADDEADEYFETRPRESQLGAWASRQSDRLPSRATLVGRYAAARLRFAGTRVPRPDFWGGFRLVADQIEFWQSRRWRLHDRIVYRRTARAWAVERLYP